MNNGNSPRILFALGAIFLSVLALTARGVGAMPKKDAWFTQHYIIMQDFERKAYRALSVDGRKENARQPWNTDRSRVYLLNGSPASIDVDQNANWGSIGLPGEMRQATDRTNEDVAANRAEVWTYQYDKYLINYIFAFVQPYQWKITQTTGNRYLGELEDFNRNVTFGITDLEKYKQDLAALEKK